MSGKLVTGSSNPTDVFQSMSRRILTSRRPVLVDSPNLTGLRVHNFLNFAVNKNLSCQNFPPAELSVFPRGIKKHIFSGLLVTVVTDWWYLRASKRGDYSILATSAHCYWHPSPLQLLEISWWQNALNIASLFCAKVYFLGSLSDPFTVPASLLYLIGAISMLIIESASQKMLPFGIFNGLVWVICWRNHISNHLPHLGSPSKIMHTRLPRPKFLDVKAFPGVLYLCIFNSGQLSSTVHTSRSKLRLLPSGHCQCQFRQLGVLFTSGPFISLFDTLKTQMGTLTILVDVSGYK
ncbi:hypothetical protein DFH09DRAFT_1496160 [Mycena vulgaris]|nr:hypothetical protein DFH09DRAFT_1496160 [Mycena vulgaris]